MKNVATICKTLSTLVLIAVLCASLSTAQTTGSSVTQKFKLQDLLEKRGKITIGVNVPTSIEFDEPIVEHIIGRDDLLIDGVSKAKPNRVYFRGKEQKGSSSIDITLEGGATALFTFTIDPKVTEGLRYVVQGKSDEAEQAGEAAPEQPVPGSSTPAPANKPKAGSSKPAATSAPTTNKPGTQTTVSNATPTTPAPDHQPDEAADTQQGAGSDKGLMIALQNSSTDIGPTAVPLMQTLNVTRHYDPQIERPGDILAYFSGKGERGFEFSIENRGTTSIELDPNVLVYVYAPSSPTSTRSTLYATLTPKGLERGGIEIAAGAAYSQRWQSDYKLEFKASTEFVASFVLVRDGQTIEYKRSILVM